MCCPLVNTVNPAHPHLPYSITEVLYKDCIVLAVISFTSSQLWSCTNIAAGKAPKGERTRTDTELEDDKVPEEEQLSGPQSLCWLKHVWHKLNTAPRFWTCVRSWKPSKLPAEFGRWPWNVLCLYNINVTHARCKSQVSTFILTEGGWRTEESYLSHESRIQVKAINAQTTSRTKKLVWAAQLPDNIVLSILPCILWLHIYLVD